MKRFDWKIWIIYICIAVIVAMLITACGASRKNTSINKSGVDSSVQIATKEIHLITTDSISAKTKQSNYTKTTDISFDIFYSKKDSTPFFIPKIHIAETGNKITDQQTHLQKKDSAGADKKENITVKKQEKKKESSKQKVSFNPLWLLAGLPLIFLFPIVRTKLKSLWRTLK